MIVVFFKILLSTAKKIVTWLIQKEKKHPKYMTMKINKITIQHIM